MISLIYNYFKLCYRMYSFDRENNNNVDVLFNQIVDSGSVCIKIVQWMLPTLEIKYNINCNIDFFNSFI